MMAEEANVAPVEAPEAPKSEATPNTNTEQTEAPKVEEAPKNTISLTEEQQKFIDANGGFEKVFSKMKTSISNPQPKEEPKVEPTVNEKLTNQPQPQAQQPQKPAEGYITPTEIAAMQYNNMLASDEKYSQISDYIRKGEFLKDMGGMGMSSVDAQGNLNDAVIRKFLDLKAQTVPAQASTTEPTGSAPTVEWVNVGETVETREDAMKVLAQKGHPKYEEAKRALANSILGKKPEKK